MEWRAQSAVSCDEAFSETRRWIEAVTKKKFGSTDFRSALENGVLLCDLINKIKPGIIKRVNRLPTPIAGLDNLNVFLKACGKLGLKEAQLFHPGDLQDLSTRVTVKHQETNRRLKNVLITIYWLGRRAQCDRFYDGPYLNFKAFEGLLGTALYKALQETSSQKGNNVRDSGFGDSWYSEREELHHLKEGGGGGGHKRDDSLDSLDSLGSQPRSISSDTTLKGGSEGCCSDTEADSGFRMADNKDHVSYRRSVAITPKASTPFNQFLPSKDKSSGYVPAPLRKKRAERNEDSRRSWGPMYTEDEGPLTRQRQMRESIDGSKSTSDIQVDPSVIRQARYEELQKYRDKIKDSEDQWQDDLSKWKSRRKSVNSDIVKKKEEREKIEQITYSSSSSSNRRSKTFKEMQEERENKGTNSIGGRLKSLSYLDDEDVFEKPVITPRTRTLPPRSYTIDTPYYSSEPPEPSPKEVEPPAASPAIGRAASPPTSLEVDTVERPAGSDATTAVAPTASSRSFSHRSQSPEAAPLQSCPVSEHTTAVETEKTTTIVSSSSSAVQKAPEPRRPLSVTQAEVEAPSSGSLYKQQPQLGSMEPKPPGVSRVSASLPRSYQRSDSARLTSVVTPRPFGTQTSRLTSLPRAFTLDDSHKRVNGDVAAVSKKSSVPTRYHQFMTSEDEAEAQSSSTHSSEDEEEEEEAKEEKSETVSSTTQSVSPVPPPVKSEAPLGPPAKESSQESYCEMRVSLNQKPNSSKDFGFQAAWDSTGARVTSIQPGSQAEMCQLRAGDEVLSVNRHKVAEMSYTDWKSCMEEALQEGSLVMDIRRHGKNNWDRHPPSLPFKSHKTINLTSTDHPALLGSPDANAVKPSLDFTSRMSREIQLPPTKEAPAQPAVDAASNGVNGGFGEETVTMRNKESEPISLKNLKRRSEFFEQGGSESAMPDIPVPAITPSSSRWSWDPEEERRRQEKWQKEQERILQEKYKRDQEKLHEEWLKAQQEITTSSEQQEPARLNSHSVSPRSPLSPVNQPATPPPWEEEERKRKEEQERLRQAEERRKREEEERELQRLQEERQRKERQEEEERKKRQEEELRWQRRREEEREEERRRQEAFEQQRRERERAFEQQQQRAVSHVQAPLSHADRTKSKSSPQLDEPQPKGVHVPPLGMAQWLLEEQLKIACDKEAQSQRAASELEMERRNILNAMRYREPERAVTGSGLLFERKGQQPGSQAEAERQQILNEMKKKTPVLTDSSWIRQRSTTTPYTKEADVPPMRRSVSGKKICTFCDAPLGKGAAMIIESLGLCYHLSCFKCIDCKSDLGGSEAGAEVRIRHKQLYCNSCYMRFKTGQPTPM
ncbi:LIM domain only protein 7 isoform X8 [Larimichthys crocea]|uniref:LIM domain only protein 7 isoform X8 n=1 Tax=Larimichthys crocea TaxID=215358 RepID=UPI000F5FF62F|nr:LIM domain only protein 7 isoform X8 [Larimichthys crocea]